MGLSRRFTLNLLIAACLFSLVDSTPTSSKRLKSSNDVQVQTAVPGGINCQPFFGFYFSFSRGTNTVTWVPFALSDYLQELLPDHVVIKSVEQPEYSALVNGVQKLWNCVNQLAIDSYNVVGFSHDDIHAFYQIGSQKVLRRRLSTFVQRTGPKTVLLPLYPQDVLFTMITNDRQLNDTHLPFTLLRYGMGQLKKPAEMLLTMMRRLIPTRTLSLVPMDSEIDALKVVDYPFFAWPYHMVRSETEMMHKSTLLLMTIRYGLTDWQHRVPPHVFSQTFKTLFIMAFQADNELVFEGMFRMLHSEVDNQIMCGMVRTIKDYMFPSQTLDKFPRITQWYRSTHRCTSLEDTPQLSDLPLHLLGKVFSHIDDIYTLATLRAVNKQWKNLVDAVPGGEACSDYTLDINLNQTSRNARFRSNFLSDYLDELLPDDVMITSEGTYEYDLVNQGLKSFLQCVNQLITDDYTVSGFSPQEWSLFYIRGLQKTVNANEHPRTHPLNMLIVHLSNQARIVDTSLALSLIESGVLKVEHLMQLMWVLMPTLKTFSTPGTPVFARAELSHARFGLFVRFEVKQDGQKLFHYRHAGGTYQQVDSEEEFRNRSRELLEAFKNGLVMSVQQSPTESPVHQVQSLLNVLSYVLPTAWAADNELVLSEVTSTQFLQSTLHQLGLTEFLRTAGQRLLAANAHLQHDRLGYQLLLRFIGLSRVRTLAMSIKDMWFAQNDMSNFARIQNWLKQVHD